MSSALDNNEQLNSLLLPTSLEVPENVALARQLIKDVTDSDFLTQRGDQYFKDGNFVAAEIVFERRCVLAAQSESAGQADLLMRLAAIYQKQNKTDDAREARRAVARTWEKSTGMTKTELSDRLLNLSHMCMNSNDTPEAERFAKKALDLRQAQDSVGSDAVIECLELMHAVALRQKRTSDAASLQKKIDKLRAIEPALDEIERAMTSYVRLPDWVDMTLREDGITLHTSDFPKLIFESTGLDLRQYFRDGFKDAEFLKQEEKDKLVADLFHCFRTVDSFVSDLQGGRLERNEVTVIDLPPGLTQDFVQKMTVERTVTFRLLANMPDDATFTDVTGITFNVGGKKIALNEFKLHAADTKCIVSLTLEAQGNVQQESKSFMDALKNAGKDLLVGAAIKMGKLPPIELPIVLQEYRDCLRDAMNFKSLLHTKEKDLVVFIERSANITVDDPLTRSLLTKGMRIIKKSTEIELVRDDKSVCDLGGVALDLAPVLKLQLAKKTDEVQIDNVIGVGVEVPFDPPSELQAIGVDLKRALPRKISSLSLAPKDEEDRRRLVVRTGPGCWMSLDLNPEMQPATDANGNWIIVGVTNNPISGVPQKFFLRLDSANNLNMTPREIAEIVTQTAIEGFDLADPFTWKWGAVALGGEALLAAGAVLRGAAGDTSHLKKTARKFGRLIGKLLNEL